ncbi:MAG: hypothetical protein L0Z73_15945 [Gammaproteobacteria bacterium]|nr:hypothetical protein [Gammaproteobacteria bacterium]
MKFNPPATTGLQVLLICACCAFTSSWAGEWRGYIAGEMRYFPQEPLDPRQFDGSNWSLSAQPEYHTQWDNGNQLFTFTAFARVDQHDDERAHADIRELAWTRVAETWELKIGIRKIFWGVTESQHLVDIVNQTDLVENIDGEEKLGQPMINLNLVRNWGTLGLFVLPGFRERTFPGAEGRLRTIPPVDTGHPIYESDAEDKHIDYAARWSHFIGIWDIGLSYFYGTSRDPLFIPNNDGSALYPVYNIINQAGLDVQATVGDWLWKLELISRDGFIDRRYTALTGGFEYTLVGILESQYDLGLLAEYLFDDRNKDATTPFDNDMLLGGRFTFNDAQSTEILAGVIVDLDNDSQMSILEASRRLGDAWKLTIEARTFFNIEFNDALYNFRHEDHLHAELAWYF